MYSTSECKPTCMRTKCTEYRSCDSENPLTKRAGINYGLPYRVPWYMGAAMYLFLQQFNTDREVLPVYKGVCGCVCV